LVDLSSLSTIFKFERLTICIGRKYGSNTGWTDDERAAFDETTIRRLEMGSKLVMIGWFGYIASLWALKASMLFFYDRIT
jgi:hypothetical protein